jgi:hypothetical protein
MNNLKGKGKRPASPTKSPRNASKAKKTLSFPPDADLDEMAGNDSDSSTLSASGSVRGKQHGSLHDMHDTGPPRWFSEFEKRQDERFRKVFSDCKELFEGFKLEVDTRMNGFETEVDFLKKKLDLAELKLDDLENRSRRCNLILFNLPEGEEGPDCGLFISDMLRKECNLNPSSIQRAHRTGKQPGPNSKPRPIHIGFAFFQEKEMCRKALAEVFKKKKIGQSNSKLFISNDYSLKVQKMRKDKLPELRRLREEGKKAYLVYPATIKVFHG